MDKEKNMEDSGEKLHEDIDQRLIEDSGNDKPIEDSDDKFIDGNFDTFTLNVANYKTRFTKKYLSRKPYQPKDPYKILAIIPGTITKVFTKKDKKVKYGQLLFTYEAMKMYNDILAPYTGRIKDVYVKEGDMVVKDQLIAEYE